MHKERVVGKKGSADFFKDSGLPNPEEFMKTQFVSIIRDVLVERGFGPGEAVETLKISESEFAVLQEGGCVYLSLDYLLLLLEKLGLYIEFVPHEIRAGATSKGFRISTSF